HRPEQAFKLLLFLFFLFRISSRPVLTPQPPTQLTLTCTNTPASDPAIHDLFEDFSILHRFQLSAPSTFIYISMSVNKRCSNVLPRV
uniref:Uncharacterized protein n=1 Tax=Periophthalmus magnuspinnatus TaxID=409849 RepID=A0A3B3ZKY2_9GOBI